MKRVRTEKSRALFARALQAQVGGVNSPVRSFRAVGGSPLFIARGTGSRVFDVDGNEFVDYVLSWGPLIAGHAHPRVVEAASKAIANGTSFGAPNEAELELTERIRSSMPELEKVRLVNSGTEACMSAVRLARAFTGRRTIVKFDGCYHGHSDSFLSKAGSGMATLGIPDSAGVPSEVAAGTITLPFNDSDAVERAFRSNGNEIAAVILEPVAGNMGVVPPSESFLREVRKASAASGALVIFDEVITGFRVARGGAQALFEVSPDITCLGKVIGGGFPVGAYGGRREIMQMVAPDGPVYQAGTLAGNPVATAAGVATLDLLDEKAYVRLEKLSDGLEGGLEDAFEDARVQARVQRVGSMVGLFFADAPVTNFEEAKRTAHALYPRFHSAMLEKGVYLPPSAFETIFLSTAHTEEEVRATAEAATEAMKGVAAR